MTRLGHILTFFETLFLYGYKLNNTDLERNHAKKPLPDFCGAIFADRAKNLFHKNTV